MIELKKMVLKENQVMDKDQMKKVCGGTEYGDIDCGYYARDHKCRTDGCLLMEGGVQKPGQCDTKTATYLNKTSYDCVCKAIV